MKPIYNLLFFIIILVFWSFPLAVISAEYTKLIFKGCANQKFQDPAGIFSQNLKNLFSSLIAQSSQRSFANTTSGNDQNAVVGVFQCRGDLTTAQCSDCVGRVPKLLSKLCGGGDNAAAARVQLAGCYLRYEVSGFRHTDNTEMLFRVCGKTPANDPGFDGKRETAFGMAENGVKNGGGGGGGFYAGQYESVYVMGQCEGSLGISECEGCVKEGFDKAKSECGDSISGQIYLNKCYISYNYYATGVPNISSLSGGGKGSKGNTERTVALAVGGVAVLGFVIVCLMCLKSALKKKRKHDDGY